MASFLETLKQGLQEAQKKFVVAQQKLAIAQAESQATQQKLGAANSEFQIALQEFQAYQTLVGTETRKTQPAAPPPSVPAVHDTHVLPRVAHTIPQTHQVVRVLAPATVPVNSDVTPNVAVQSVSGVAQPGIDDNKSESNQTQAVRQLLREHSTGMTPGEMWKELQSQLSNRVYLYSILKRLKDRGDVREKRGKYYFNLKPPIEENHNHAAIQ